jgi:hypothetical protein
MQEINVEILTGKFYSFLEAMMSQTLQILTPFMHYIEYDFSADDIMMDTDLFVYTFTK